MFLLPIFTNLSMPNRHCAKRRLSCHFIMSKILQTKTQQNHVKQYTFIYKKSKTHKKKQKNLQNYSIVVAIVVYALDLAWCPI
jgi:hypothetical protein